MPHGQRTPLWAHLLFGPASVGLFILGAFFVLARKELEIGAFCLVFAGLGFVMWNRAVRPADEGSSPLPETPAEKS